MNSILITLSSPRFLAIASTLMFWLYFYDAAYIQNRESTSAPYPFLFFFSLLGNISGVYLIEKHENKWQLYSGYFVLTTFFLISIGAGISWLLN